MKAASTCAPRRGRVLFVLTAILALYAPVAVADSGAAAETDGIGAPEFLGDLDKDYVYTAVPPCRIVDTRNAPAWIGFPIPPGGVISFVVYGNVAAQTDGNGGTYPDNCPSPRGEPQAVHINVTAIPFGNGGNLRAYPHLSPVPSASLVNYKPNTNIANAATVKTNYMPLVPTPDIDLKSTQTSHVVVDVMGYYHEVDPKNLVRGNHAGHAVYVATIEPFPPEYQFVDDLLSGSNYDDDPHNGAPGDGDIMVVQQGSDVMVQATVQVWSDELGNTVPIEGAITPCFRQPGAPPFLVDVCVDWSLNGAAGPEAETDFCVTSEGYPDQNSVQTSCIFRDMPAGIWEFGVCAKPGSSYGCNGGQEISYAISGVKVDIIKLPE